MLCKRNKASTLDLVTNQPRFIYAYLALCHGVLDPIQINVPQIYKPKKLHQSNETGADGELGDNTMKYNFHIA